MTSEQHFIESVESRRLFSAFAAFPWMPPAGGPSGAPLVYFAPPAIADSSGVAANGAAVTFLQLAAAVQAANPITSSASAATSTAASNTAPLPAATLHASAAAEAVPVQQPAVTDSSRVPDVITHADLPNSAPSSISTRVAASTAPTSSAAALPVTQAAASTSWALAATAARAEMLTLDESLLNASDGLRQEINGWTAAFEHTLDRSPLPAVSDTLVRDFARGLERVTAEAEHLLLETGLHRSEGIEALAAVFAGGAFSAWWLDSREEDSAPEADSQRAPFCDDLIGFGHARA